MSRDNSTESQGVSDSLEEPKVANVTFNPALWLQRRTWVLNQLRAHRVTSVIDLGCGEGSLLSVLCQPASTIPPKETLQCTIEPTLDIHLKRLVGLDVCPESLEIAVHETTPPPTSGTKAFDDLVPWERPRPRWLDLHVQIYQGGLEVLNGDEDGGWFGKDDGGWDGIVSTEVVEHIPSSILDHFLPTTLGIYTPNFLLLTTPNYTYNQLFTPPNVLNTLTGFPDPTGETDRIFRHHDHKREWTMEEWVQWCERGAREWGYDVSVDALGVAEEEDPWGRTKDAGKASLTAVFRRKELPLDSKERVRLEARRKEALLAARGRTKPETAHKLVVTHHYAPHPSTGAKPSRSTILAAVQALLEPAGDLGLRGGTCSLDELWLQDSLAIVCGGNLDLLIDAVENTPSEEWELLKDLPATSFGRGWREEKWGWEVRWKGYVKPPTPEPQPEPGYGEEGAEDTWGDRYRWRISQDAWRGWADDDKEWEQEEQEVEEEPGDAQSSPPTTPSPTEEKEGTRAEDSWANAPAADWGLGNWNISNWNTEEATWA